jgi:hypothetical protein
MSIALSQASGESRKVPNGIVYYDPLSGTLSVVYHIISYVKGKLATDVKVLGLYGYTGNGLRTTDKKALAMI